jgi:hypothetical protein
MTDKLRRAHATAAAARYVPPPDGSHLVYALVAAAVVAAAAIPFVGLLGVDMLTHPTSLVAITLAALGSGVAGRVRQRRRHASACAPELAWRGRRMQGEAT